MGAYKEEVYKKHADVASHESGVLQQYDTKEKLDFYAEVMGDGTDNIHFGKWDGIDVDAEGAYGRASDAMTDFMFNLVWDLAGKKEKITYVDLGSGTGAAARRICKANAGVDAACLNLCPEQNATNEASVKEMGLDGRVRVSTGTYEKCPYEDAAFDLAFSQDAFVHAFSKLTTYREALRIVKPGGAFAFCDLMCGDGPGVSADELATFAQTNMVNDWLSPEQNVAVMKEAGWEDVTFVDLTADIKLSFELMGRKVAKILDSGVELKVDPVLLKTYRENLEKRVGQVDRGVFKWGVIHARKPVNVNATQQPPVAVP